MIDGLVYIGDADPIALSPPLMFADRTDEFFGIAGPEGISDYFTGWTFGGADAT